MKLLAFILLLFAVGPLCAADVGDSAPDFAFEKTWNMGSEQSLSAFRGKVVLLEYWATW